jgi:hypothetical protein
MATTTTKRTTVGLLEMIAATQMLTKTKAPDQPKVVPKEAARAVAMIRARVAAREAVRAAVPGAVREVERVVSRKALAEEGRVNSFPTWAFVQRTSRPIRTA